MNAAVHVASTLGSMGAVSRYFLTYMFWYDWKFRCLIDSAEVASKISTLPLGTGLNLGSGQAALRWAAGILITKNCESPHYILVAHPQCEVADILGSEIYTKLIRVITVFFWKPEEVAFVVPVSRLDLEELYCLLDVFCNFVHSVVFLVPEESIHLDEHSAIAGSWQELYRIVGSIDLIVTQAFDYETCLVGSPCDRKDTQQNGAGGQESPEPDVPLDPP